LSRYLYSIGICCGFTALSTMARPKSPSPASSANSPRQTAGLLVRIPWLALTLVWLGYVLLGWHLSIYHIAWEVSAWVMSLLLTILCIWGGGSIYRLLRMGPRSIFTMLMLSAAVTVAAVASAIFALITIVLAAEVLTRVEMLISGFNQWQILITLSLVATLGMTVGWWAGTTNEYLLPNGLWFFS
jgi:cation transport ATPase